MGQYSAAPVPPCLSFSGRTASPAFQVKGSEAAEDPKWVNTQLLLYLHISLGRFVRFALPSRFVSFRHNRVVFFSGRTAPSSFSNISKVISSSRRAIRSFRVRFAFRFVSALQGCIFLWADSSVFLSTASFFFYSGTGFNGSNYDSLLRF